MSQHRFTIPDWLHESVARATFAAAKRHDVSPAKILSGSKESRVPEARGDVIAWLYSNVCETTVPKRCQSRFILRKQLFGSEEPFYRNLSLPKIGYILNIDHSTVLLSRKRWLQRQKEEGNGTHSRKSDPGTTDVRQAQEPVGVQG